MSTMIALPALMQMNPFSKLIEPLHWLQEFLFRVFNGISQVFVVLLLKFSCYESIDSDEIFGIHCSTQINNKVLIYLLMTIISLLYFTIFVVIIAAIVLFQWRIHHILADSIIDGICGIYYFIVIGYIQEITLCLLFHFPLIYHHARAFNQCFSYDNNKKQDLCLLVMSAFNCQD